MQEQSLVITSKAEMSHDTKTKLCCHLLNNDIYQYRFVMFMATYNEMNFLINIFI